MRVFGCAFLTSLFHKCTYFIFILIGFMTLLVVVNEFITAKIIIIRVGLCLYWISWGIVMAEIIAMRVI